MIQTDVMLARKRSGAVYTPIPIARLLADWAIHKPSDRVLDLGVGEGIFALEASRRLAHLGAELPAHQIYGSELDVEAFERFRVVAGNEGPFPNVTLGDFFETSYPRLDAIVGNPPYVSRVHMPSLDVIRSAALPILGPAGNLYRLADLYCYFVIYATQFLRPKGRLAVVLSSSWLDTNFGKDFKRFLLQQYSINSVISFEPRVFGNALIKSVLLTAERTEADRSVTFLREKRNLRRSLDDIDTLPSGDHDAYFAMRIEQSRLNPDESWGYLLKRPDIIFRLLETGRFCKLRRLAESRIGVQTLAKDFFILTSTRATESEIEPEYLEPLAFSPRTIPDIVIAAEDQPSHYLFAASNGEDQLPFGARNHIQWGMAQQVTVRGTTWQAPGYHHAPRLKRSGRVPWYNLRTHLDGRGRWPILLPRRIYETYDTVWNRAGWIGNEDFIEVRPKRQDLTQPLLAVLNSHLGEFAIRSQAQQYGGGVYNLLPSDVPQIIVPDLDDLPDVSLAQLTHAFCDYLEKRDRTSLSRQVGEVIGLSTSLIEEVISGAQGLRSLSSRAKAVRGSDTEREGLRRPAAELEQDDGLP